MGNRPAGTVLEDLPVELARRDRHDHAPEVRFLGSRERASAPPGGSLLVVCRRGRLRRTREAASSAEAIAPIVRVTYHGTPILEGVLGRREFGELRAVLPFAGGRLDPERFCASTYVAPGDDAPAMTTLVTVREPELSDLESKAEDRLALAMSQRGLGGFESGMALARLVELRAALTLAGRLS